MSGQTLDGAGTRAYKDNIPAVGTAWCPGAGREMELSPGFAEPYGGDLDGHL